MDKEQIKNLILEVMREEGGVLPFHLHNGIDAPKLYLVNLEEIKRGSATFNPGNLVDGAGETTTITVRNIALGDIVLASFSLDLQGILLTAYVSAANTVSVRFQNETGGAIDLGSGTLSVIIIKNI